MTSDGLYGESPLETARRTITYGDISGRLSAHIVGAAILERTNTMEITARIHEISNGFLVALEYPGSYSESMFPADLQPERPTYFATFEELTAALPSLLLNARAKAEDYMNHERLLVRAKRRAWDGQDIEPTDYIVEPERDFTHQQDQTPPDDLPAGEGHVPDGITLAEEPQQEQ